MATRNNLIFFISPFSCPSRSFGFCVKVPAVSLYDTELFPKAHPDCVGTFNGPECTRIKVMFFAASQSGDFVVCVHGGHPI